MSHVRQQIRERIAELIQNVPVIVAGSVDESNEYPRAADTLPTFTVHISNEQVQADRSTIGQVIYVRLAQVVITIHAKGVSGVDDTLDDWAVAVEEIMAADRKVSGLAIDSELRETEIELDATADQITGRMAITYAVEYATDANQVEAPLA